MIGIISYFEAAVALLLLGSTIARLSRKLALQFSYNVIMLAVLILVIAMYAVLGISATYFRMVSINPFSEFFMLIITVAMLLVNLLAYGSENYANFAIFSDFALAGMYMVAFANSLITIFIGIELMTLPTAFAVLSDRRGLEAAAKLFIMASVSIAFFAFGIVLMYGVAGIALAAAHANATVMLFTALLFIIAIGFEASIFPFNLWVPDVYQGAKTHVTSMLGGINKKVGFIALMQVLILIFISYHVLFMLAALLATLTMFFGNIVALAQENVKRMFAYSSIAQAGYILIGISAATAYGVASSIFQIFAHMFAFIGIMAVIIVMENKNRRTINDFVGLNSENKLVALAFSVMVLSLLGMPFTAGFIGKFMLFSSAVYAKLWWLALIGIINTAISLYYYAKVIIAVYTGKAHARIIKPNPYVYAVILACFVIVLAFGIYPQPVISAAQNAAGYLFR